jgi:beta-galactosidase/beta-glucuronidase
MRTLLLALVSATILIGQSIPRPEYPQPQFQRETWQSLNGAWEFEFDDADKGLAEGWESSTRKFSRTITVPFAPETKLSGIGDTAFHPYVWYRKSVTLPASFQGKNTLLHFGAVDYVATVWVNGRYVGEHLGGGTPFHFDITHLLKSGANQIVLRAEDQPTDRAQPRGKQYWQPKSRGIFYTRTTGIWQSVWLEATGTSHLTAVRVTPSNDGTVKLEARANRNLEGLEFIATVSREGKKLSSTSARLKDFRSEAALAVSEPQLWSLGSPNLYDIAFELRHEGKVIDKVQSYFGFRKIGLNDAGRVTINSTPVYLKMVLDQGYWPESTLTPPSDEAIQFDIKAMKEMGFNGARKHQKIEDPRFHYWADKLGFLVSGEIANAYRYDETYAQRFQREWAEAVERDYNHPSVIMWIPINESWGVHDVSDRRQTDHLRAMYLLTKSLDPSRFVIDNDGWEHADLTDLFGIHDYTPTGEGLYEKYKNINRQSKAVPRNGREANAPGFAYNGSPIFLSEFGGISYIKPGSTVPEESWGYSGVEKNAEAALSRLQGQFIGIAKIAGFMGICYTQLTDVEQEINGLYTYDRKPKFDPAEVKKLNDLLK